MGCFFLSSMVYTRWPCVWKIICDLVFQTIQLQSNNFNHHIEENQFASFIHKSIKPKESKELNKTIQSNSKKKKISKTINYDSDKIKMNIRENEIDDSVLNKETYTEINFLESLSESCDYQSCNNSVIETDIDDEIGDSENNSDSEDETTEILNGYH